VTVLLITLFTFPGVIVHEAAHMLFCRVRGVAVLDVCFLRFENPVGYVLHEPPKDLLSVFLISLAPFALNNVLCIFFCFPAMLHERLRNQLDPLSLFLIWLGVSIGTHALPSSQDASILWREARVAARKFNPLAIISLPLVVIVHAANLLPMRFRYLYGALVGLGLPEMLLNRLV
jgi:hypothetical protein